MQVILKHQEIHQKITRLAYQILEQCTDQEKIFIGGIQGNGMLLATYLKQVIDAHGTLNTQIFEIEINKVISEQWIWWMEISDKVQSTLQSIKGMSYTPGSTSNALKSKTN